MRFIYTFRLVRNFEARADGVTFLEDILTKYKQEKGDFPGLSENPFAKLLNVLFPSAKNVENGHFIRARLQNMRYMRDCA